MRNIDELHHISTQVSAGAVVTAITVRRMINARRGMMQLPVHKIAAECGRSERQTRRNLSELARAEIIDRATDQPVDCRQRANRYYWNGVPVARQRAGIEYRRALHRSTSRERKLYNEAKAKARAERQREAIQKAIVNGAQALFSLQKYEQERFSGADINGMALQDLKPSTFLTSEALKRTLREKGWSP